MGKGQDAVSFPPPPPVRLNGPAFGWPSNLCSAQQQVRKGGISWGLYFSGRAPARSKVRSGKIHPNGLKRAFPHKARSVIGQAPPTPLALTYQFARRSITASLIKSIRAREGPTTLPEAASAPRNGGSAASLPEASSSDGPNILSPQELARRSDPNAEQQGGPLFL